MKLERKNLVLSPHILWLIPLLLLLSGGHNKIVTTEKLPHPNTGTQIDPAKVQGAETCKVCHTHEYTTWKQTTHYRSPSVREDNKKLNSIAAKMGIAPEDIEYEKNECLDCHYTSKLIRGEIHPLFGISCESCHGGAKEWYKMHSYYGDDRIGRRANRETEMPDHRKERLMRGVELGMIRPDTPYLLAENCYQCHTVPDEKLVNIGGHPPGSEFELVSWLMGEVRHNFFHSRRKTNREASRRYDPIIRNRLLYVVGQMLELEYSLRGLSKATRDGFYYQSMKIRVEKVMEKLAEMETKAPILNQPVSEMLTIGSTVGLLPNNESTLIDAAEKVRAMAKEFVTKHDGSKLVGIEKMLPAKDKYIGPVLMQ